jgi:autotransporter-associated beta strand protein
LTIQADDNGTGGGGVLYLSSYNQTLGSLASSTSNGGTDTPTVNLGTGALTINQSISTTFAGRITGSGTLTKAGNGTLTLSGANTYTGGTTISGGRLEGAVSGSIPGNVNNPAGTLQLDNASAMASAANLTLASAPERRRGEPQLLRHSDHQRPLFRHDPKGRRHVGRLRRHPQQRRLHRLGRPQCHYGPGLKHRPEPDLRL